MLEGSYPQKDLTGAAHLLGKGPPFWGLDGVQERETTGDVCSYLPFFPPSPIEGIFAAKDVYLHPPLGRWDGAIRHLPRWLGMWTRLREFGVKWCWLWLPPAGHLTSLLAFRALIPPNKGEQVILASTLRWGNKEDKKSVGCWAGENNAPLLLNCCIIRQHGGEALLFSSVEGMGRIQWNVSCDSYSHELLCQSPGGTTEPASQSFTRESREEQPTAAQHTAFQGSFSV